MCRVFRPSLEAYFLKRLIIKLSIQYYIFILVIKFFLLFGIQKLITAKSRPSDYLPITNTFTHRKKFYFLRMLYFFHRHKNGQIPE